MHKLFPHKRNAATAKSVTRCCVCTAMKPSQRERESEELAEWTDRYLHSENDDNKRLEYFFQTTTRESNKFFQTTLIFHNAFSDLNRIIDNTT